MQPRRVDVGNATRGCNARPMTHYTRTRATVLGQSHTSAILKSVPWACLWRPDPIRAASLPAIQLHRLIDLVNYGLEIFSANLHFLVAIRAFRAHCVFGDANRLFFEPVNPFPSALTSASRSLNREKERAMRDNQILRACVAIDAANQKARKHSESRLYADYPLSTYQLDCLLAFDHNARFACGVNPITDSFQVETD